MTGVFIQTAKYLMIALTLVYTVQSFLIYLRPYGERAKSILLREQLLLIYLILSLGFLSMTAFTEKTELLRLYLLSVALISAIQLIYRWIYRYGSILLCNHICMLLATGLLSLSRLSEERTLRQIGIAFFSVALTAFLPYLMSKRKNRLRRLKWVYGAVGLLLLLLLFALGEISYGAKISVSVFGVQIQPAEFVKLLFVFFIAGMYHEARSLRQILLTGLCALAFLLLLALNKDLGTALIFFVIYVSMTYVAAKKWYILPIAAGTVLLVMLVASRAMSHVSNRILAWKDPLAVIEDQGYQVSQSLFAIGTGGWVGSGLYQGKPGTIPVAAKDFIFSAICEEFGAVYGIAIILICFSILVLILHIAKELKDPFYRLVALGFGVSYGFQVFLTIGGCIKLIPSTGVTLPLVSYGGSSLLATFMMLALVESLYMTGRKRDSR